MKKMRKGFTLVELLIVVAIIGILAGMMMISGSEASDAAKVLKISEGFKNVSAAMETYDANTINSGEKDADDIVKGIKPYLNDQEVVDSVTSATGGDVGIYSIFVNTDGSWWICYKLSNKEAPAIGTKLKDKAKKFGFYKSTTVTVPTSSTGSQYDYDGGQFVYVKVRS